MLPFEKLEPSIAQMHPFVREMLYRSLRYQQSERDIALEFGIPEEAVKKILVNASNRAIWSTAFREDKVNEQFDEMKETRNA